MYLFATRILSRRRKNKIYYSICLFKSSFSRSFYLRNRGFIIICKPGDSFGVGPCFCWGCPSATATCSPTQAHHPSTHQQSGCSPVLQGFCCRTELRLCRKKHCFLSHVSLHQWVIVGHSLDFGSGRKPDPDNWVSLSNFVLCERTTAYSAAITTTISSNWSRAPSKSYSTTAFSMTFYYQNLKDFGGATMDLSLLMNYDQSDCLWCRWVLPSCRCTWGQLLSCGSYQLFRFAFEKMLGRSTKMASAMADLVPDSKSYWVTAILQDYSCVT